MASTQEPEIIGYAEPWINSPGDLVSSTESLYRYRLVRLIQGFEHSHAPERKVEVIKTIDSGTVSGRYQRARPGSYAVVDNLGLTASHVGIDIEFFFQPSLIDYTRDQVLVSILSPTGQAGIEIAIDRDGFMVVSIHTGNGSSCREQTHCRPTVGRWASIKCRALWNMIEISAKSLPSLDGVMEKPSDYHQKITTEIPFNVPKPGRATFAARERVNIDGAADGFFNGRIEDVTICALEAQGHTQVLAQYDFSQEMASDSILDVSRNSRHGYLVNAPTRAVRGHNWDGKEVDWTKATYGYGAIHFHEDDLDDARWDTDFEIKLPADLRSGAYAVEVESVGHPHVRDDITFFVRPRSDSSARIALVLSTFTYLAYANERMFDQTRPSHLAVPGEIQILEDENYKRMLRRCDLGHSLYDVHRDLSGTVFSSSKRPLLNVRPGYQHWAFRRPREFSADLLMVGFLEHLGLPYDVCLDHDLHTDGIEAIASYSTLITGSHPENPTIESLDAYSEFQRRGGSLLYLGGNGFYWMAAVDSARPHRVEVRRGDQGVRTFALPGGEHHHSLTGAKGGLWRSRGRPANYLVGVLCWEYQLVLLARLGCVQ